MGPPIILDFEQVQIRNAARARHLLGVLSKEEIEVGFLSSSKSHSHAQSDVTNLVSDLAAKLPHVISRKMSWITAGASGSALSGFGESLSHTGSPSSSGADANQGHCLNLASGASNGSQCGFHTGTAQYRVGNNCQFAVLARVMESANLIFWAVMADGTLATFNGNDPAANLFGFRYSTSAGDAVVQCAAKDGATLNLSGSGIAWANSMNLFEASMNDVSGVATFKINGIEVATLNSNLPAPGTVMRFVCGVTTLEAAAKNIRIQRGVLVADR